MSRSKQRSRCPHSCYMCDPGKSEKGIPKVSDRRRMQDDPKPGKTRDPYAYTRHDP